MGELKNLKPIYFPSECNIDKELFLPLAIVASSFDCMVGYFTSGSLEELARSIACYLSSDPQSKMRLIASPNLSENDINAIKEALHNDKDLLPLLFPSFEITEKTLRANSIKALCYLISAERLELKVAVQDEGLFHTKCWLIETDQGSVAIHGSGNATKSGLMKNFEQLAVARTWLSDESKEVYHNLRERFNSLWKNEYKGILCAALNDKTIEQIEKINLENGNTLDKDNWTISNEIKEDLLRELENSSFNESKIEVQKLKIPSWLNYESGSYAHQGEAVKAWIENNYKGILSIATGGGKTLTSLVAASILSRKLDKLFIVISVPTTTLLNQWQSDVRDFDVEPISTLGSNAKTVRRNLKEAGRKLRLGLSRVEVLLITHESLKGNHSTYLESLSSNFPFLLIGDEVHNMGSEGFKKAPPGYFKYHLGLSATYERAFDDEGNSFLLSYFGKVVFEYPLEKAIGNCLVPYEYYAHEVSLTADEEEEFLELTHQIKKISYASNLADGDKTKDRLKTLFLKRRRVIESARNKVGVFDAVLPSNKDEISRTLVFCTDKYPEQLDDINNVLKSRSLEFHQVTQEETKNSKALKGIVDSFSDGDLKVLTSKRVLDEGFNVPQTEVAYLIASQTGRRQWIQRLGRILRLSSKTTKEKAILHDMIVIPPTANGSFDDDFKSMIRSEYERLKFFTKLSLNGLEEGGSIYLTNKLLNILRGK